MLVVTRSLLFGASLLAMAHAYDGDVSEQQQHEEALSLLTPTTTTRHHNAGTSTTAAAAGVGGGGREGGRAVLVLKGGLAGCFMAGLLQGTFYGAGGAGRGGACQMDNRGVGVTVAMNAAQYGSGEVR